MDIQFKEKAKNFISNMPYKQTPYSSRNWGHSWHSLCSYHGKLKPAIAQLLISEFTDAGDVILDPLCGVGTIPFEACLQGRIGIGNDLSEMAYIVTKAKVEKPLYADVQKVLCELNNYIDKYKDTHSVEEYKDFGLNGKLPAYFEKNTYKEILCARTFFLEKIENITAAEAMVFSALLHVLHGNRPYALSRHSHPLTPYAPSGKFEYKKVIDKISQKIISNYKEQSFDLYQSGQSIYGDYSALKDKNIKVDWIICSPPFADSMRFYINNWMRLWLCGWEPSDYKNADHLFLDYKQKKNFDIYFSFFEMCNNVLVSGGKIILHLGKTKKVDMAQELSARSTQWFDVVYSAGEEVEKIEKHGIKDKGRTIEHQFLFLQKK